MEQHRTKSSSNLSVCLTNNAADGNFDTGGFYIYRRPGTSASFPPLMKPDRSPKEWIPFGAGSLTDGTGKCPVEWANNHMGPNGVDVVFDLGRNYWLESVVVEQDPRDADVTSYDDPHSRYRRLATVVISVMKNGEDQYCREQTIEVDVRRAPRRIVIGSLEVSGRWVRVGLKSGGRALCLRQIHILGRPLSPHLFPMPPAIHWESGYWVLPASLRIAADESLRGTLAPMCERLRERHGIASHFVADNSAPGTLPRGLSIHLTKTGRTTAHSSMPVEEGYRLTVSRDGARIEAAAPRGAFWGFATFIQMIEARDNKRLMRCAAINDHPYYPVRSVHLWLPAEEDIPFFKRLIATLSELKFNMVFLELTGGMRFDSHPELHTAWERKVRAIITDPLRYLPLVMHADVAGGKVLSKSRVRELAAYCRRFNIEPVPAIDFLSHCHYLLAAHRELAEVPGREIPEEYCPSHPDIYPIVYDLVDEIIEVFQPRMMHIGHDEVRNLAKCPRCRGKKPVDLFVDDTLKIYRYLKKRGVKDILIWGDHLLEKHNGQFDRTTPAIRRLPKDLIIADWSWGASLVPKSYDIIKGAGFRHLWTLGYNNYFANCPYLMQRRARTGSLGVISTTWVKCCEFKLGLQCSFMDMLYNAENFWTPDHPPFDGEFFFERARLTYAHLRRQVRNEATVERRRRFSPIRLNGAFNTTYGQLTGTRWVGFPNPRYRWYAGIPFDVWGEGAVVVQNRQAASRFGTGATSVMIPINGRFDEFHVLQSCLGSEAFTWEQGLRNLEVGAWELVYAHGRPHVLPIIFGYHLREWSVPHGYTQSVKHHLWGARIGWRGKTDTGSDVTLYVSCLRNPHPDRKIRALRFSSAPKASHLLPFALGVTGAVGQRPAINNNENHN